MTQIPECFYRVSIKALVLNETQDKFLIVQEKNGRWDLPGGGLDWGMTPQEDLPREIMEEMSLNVTSISDFPSYFITFKHNSSDAWMANVLYEATLNSLHFIPSGECVKIKFVNKDTLGGLELKQNIIQLANMFDVARHLR